MKRPYLENAEFERSILEGDRDAVAVSLLLLAERVILVWGKDIPTILDRDDLRQDAVMAAIRRLEGWDKGRGSAFAYATESIKLTIRDHRKYAMRRTRRFRALPKYLAG